MDGSSSASSTITPAYDHITHQNLLADAVNAIQEKLGVTNSANTSSIDYLLRSTSSVDPGHKHTAASISDFTAAVQALANVTSVFGRTGAITAQTGDYTVAQVTGAAPLASPTFTGTPAAPTAAPGTNTTQIATTAFVLANGTPGGSSGQLQYNNAGAFGGAAWSAIATSGNLFQITPPGNSDKALVAVPKTTAASITNIVVATAVATITTSAAHGFVKGRTVTIAGATTLTALNGTWQIATVPSTTTFTVTAASLVNTASSAETGTATAITMTSPILDVQDWSSRSVVAIRSAPGDGVLYPGGGNQYWTGINALAMSGESYIDTYSYGRGTWTGLTGPGGMVEPWLTFTHKNSSTAGGARIAYRYGLDGAPAYDACYIDFHQAAFSGGEMTFFVGGTNSNATPKAAMTILSSGSVLFNYPLRFTTATATVQIGYSNNVDANANLFLGTNTTKGLVLQLPQFSSNNAFELQAAGGNTVIAGISYLGNWWMGGTSGSGTTRLVVSAKQTTDVAAAFQAITSQTGNLTEWRNSSGTALNYVGPNGGLSLSQAAATGAPLPVLLTTAAAHTALTASTERTEINLNLSATQQFATGALTTQRAVRIQAPTYGFVGASTITTAVTLDISGAPIAGTNATITNSYALRVNAGQATAVALVVKAAPSQSASVEEWQNSSGTVLSRLNKDGYFMTRKVAAPADADLATSEVAIWLDDTSGSAKFMVKCKDSGGTVRTGSVTLS